MPLIPAGCLKNHHGGQTEVRETQYHIVFGYIKTWKKKKMPTATFCAPADVSSILVMQLIRFHHKPMLGRNDRMHSDAAVRSSSVMQQKTVKASLFFSIIKQHKQPFSVEPVTEA